VINFVERKNGIVRPDKARVIRQFTLPILRIALASTPLTPLRFAERLPQSRAFRPAAIIALVRFVARAGCVRFVDRKATLETAPEKYYIGYSSRRARSRKHC